jgi:branched-chain amino acid transport system permease protein
MLRSARTLGIFAAAVAIANVVIDDRFFLRILILTLLWASAGVAWGLVAKAGQISLGHSAFTGIGALTFVLLLRDSGLSPWLGMVVGILLSVLAALVIGIPTLRLRGFYFALATAALPLILMLIALHLGHAEVTIPFRLDQPLAFMQFREPGAYVWISLGLLVVTVAIAETLDASRLGLAMRAIRDNEILAGAVGIGVARAKLVAFVISAALVSAMSVVWTNGILLIVTPREVFSLEVVVVMISVSFVGGVTRTWGPVLGAALLIPLSQLLTSEIGDDVPGAETLVYGGALVLVALAAPDGILPRLERLARRRRRRGGAAPAAGAEPAAAAPARWSELIAEPARGGAPDVGLHAGGVEKRFGGLQVLRDVDLPLEPGRRAGLIGPNGAGKTTLFNVLCGYLRVDGGSVEWNGRDIGRLGPGARYRLGISRTFQVPQGFAAMTPAENVRVAAVGYGLGVEEAAERASAVLAAVGLEAQADDELQKLTTLGRKLLELARAAVSRPALLLLDEPLAGLTHVEHADFFAALDRVVPAETSVLIVEHSVRSLVPHVELLFALDEGVMIAAGPPHEVVRNEKVIASYLGSRWRRGEGASSALRP